LGVLGRWRLERVREKGVGLGQGSDGKRHRGLGAERRIDLLFFSA
jgi:hypothetical protein